MTQYMQEAGAMKQADDSVEREFSEYARIARLRIPFVANGYRLALDAYRQERKNPTPLMLQAAENIRAADEEVKKRCAAAGVRWIPPENGAWMPTVDEGTLTAGKQGGDGVALPDGAKNG